MYFERWAPRSAVRRCQWNPPPRVHDYFETDSTAFGRREVVGSDKTNVLLVADPQLIDNHTYPGRNSMLLKLSQHTVDVYLKRNYNALVKNLKPDYIVFLGDYLDNGRSSTDDYFLGQWSRFQSIFYNKFKSKYIQNQNLFWNLPGNHDIGFGDEVKLPLRERFTSKFGSPNLVHRINDVEFVFLDSLSYSSLDPAINSDAVNFVNSISSKSGPRILLSHVPLYRDESISCGPLRENPKNFKYVSGYQYQTFIDPDRTEELLTKLEPELIFSGDDHDYCEMYHDDPRKTKHEFTVKSISMAMGIKYPAVQLLSFSNGPDGFDYNSRLCYIQTPYVNIAAYVTFAVISGLLIIWWNIKQRSSRYNYSILPMINTSSIALRSRPGTPYSTPVSSTTNSAKISNFLKDQDTNTSGRYFNIPTYTSTTYASTSTFLTKLKSSKYGKYYYQMKNELVKFMKKWNVVLFTKHCVLYGMFVICLYYFGFCLTL